MLFQGTFIHFSPSYFQHINAPLMEFERKKLMIEYKVRPPGSKERIESAKTAEEEPIFFDYM